jgi:hypothetical protein
MMPADITSGDGDHVDCLLLLQESKEHLRDIGTWAALAVCDADDAILTLLVGRLLIKFGHGTTAILACLECGR